MSAPIRIRCPGRAQPERESKLIRAMFNTSVPESCGGHLDVIAEHTFPLPSYPARYMAQCDECRGYWTVGVLDVKRSVRKVSSEGTATCEVSTYPAEHGYRSTVGDVA